MDKSVVLKWYKQSEVCEALAKLANQREVVAFYSNRFGKRPNAFFWPKDFIELVKNGATSFHCSLERWSNPLDLEIGKNLDQLRVGWDLVIDIDSAHLDISTIAAKILIKALKHYEIDFYLKFSGNRGWHIAIPWEAFPPKIGGEATSLLYPYLPRKIIAFLSNLIEPFLAEELIGLANKFPNLFKIFKNEKIRPFEIVKLDYVAISNRHLYRMPWCFNEKTGLISMPINEKTIDDFEISLALPKAGFSGEWLNKAQKNQALKLCQEVIDWEVEKEKQTIERESESFSPKSKNLPPCIKKIFEGLTDGRKRSLFILINFFGKKGFDAKAIEEKINSWNLKNKPPLSNSYIKAQINYYQKRGAILPPNCITSGYYRDMGICFPDSRCAKIKNPINY